MGHDGRVGLDFWLARQRDKPRTTSFIGSAIDAITVPGPDGAVPTLRFQLFREGVQEVEIRTGIIRAYLKLPEDQRKQYRDLLDELPGRAGRAGGYLNQQELNFDWPEYEAYCLPLQPTLREWPHRETRIAATNRYLRRQRADRIPPDGDPAILS